MQSRMCESAYAFWRKAGITASALGLALSLTYFEAPPAFARTAAAPHGELALDAADPVIDVMVAGRPVRLLVDSGQWDSIELNPGVADRLALPWQAGRVLEIGRVFLPGRVAPAVLSIAGQGVPVLVSSHGRAATPDADGVIGPDLLPFATIRWRRIDAPPPSDTLTFPLILAPSIGLAATDPRLPLPIHIRFSSTHADSVATGAAGSFLAQRFGGKLAGSPRQTPVLLGVTRPARAMTFARPPAIAGFRFPDLTVRIADFRGDNPLPEDAGASDDIVVKRRDVPQPAQSWVTIGRDRLSRCAEIVYTAEPRSLSLSCAF